MMNKSGKPQSANYGGGNNCLIGNDVEEPNAADELEVSTEAILTTNKKMIHLHYLKIWPDSIQ